jgi:subtilase family serine protease
MRGNTLGRAAALTLVGTLGWIGCSDQESLTGPAAGAQLQIQGSRPEIEAAPLTDVAVVSVSAPGSVNVGNTVDVVVTLQNVGTQAAEGFGVVLFDQTDNVLIGCPTGATGCRNGVQILPGLDAGASAILTFSWNTTASSLGTHTLVGLHGLADGSAANNQATTTVAITGVLTDVSVIAVYAPGPVIVGNTVDAVVTVRNVGNQDVARAFGVALVDQTDNVVIGSQPVAGLAAGATAILTFSWNTTGRSIGSHLLVGFHGLADRNGFNNSASSEVVVTGPLTDVAVIGVSAPASATVGNTVDVVVTLKNVGNQNVPQTFGVALREVGGVTIGFQSVAGLAVGATATVTFSWNTTGSFIGSHLLAGFHGLADGNGANNLATTSVAITAP